jgi:hypothetical protein
MSINLLLFFSKLLYILKSAQAYKAQIRRTQNLQRVPKRNFTGVELIGANPAAAPVAICCVGLGYGCIIAYEICTYGHSKTLDELKWISKELQYDIDKYVDIFRRTGTCEQMNNGDFIPLTNKEAERIAHGWGYVKGRPDFDTHGEIAS